VKRIILIAVISVILFATACGRDTLDEALADRVGESIDAGVGSRLDPQALTDFDWDKLWVFGAYTPGDVIEEAIGFSWGRSKYAAPLSDGQFLLVFTLEDRVVRHAVVQGDLRPLVRDEPWLPGDVFIVRESWNRWGSHIIVLPLEAASP